VVCSKEQGKEGEKVWSDEGRKETRLKCRKSLRVRLDTTKTKLGLFADTHVIIVVLSSSGIRVSQISTDYCRKLKMCTFL
jgi:hypothetical protein